MWTLWRHFDLKEAVVTGSKDNFIKQLANILRLNAMLAEML